MFYSFLKGDIAAKNRAVPVLRSLQNNASGSRACEEKMVHLFKSGSQAVGGNAQMGEGYNSNERPSDVFRPRQLKKT